MLAILFTSIVAGGCSYAHQVNLEQEPLSQYSNVEQLDYGFHSFLGRWLLKDIVLRVHHAGELELPPQAYTAPPAEDFLGLELEVSAEFVRPGDRTLYSPTFLLRETSVL